MERRITIPPKTRELLSRLSSAGFAAYAVGGCVRDSLLGQAPQDWDVCTSARPEEILACFQTERTILTGVRYGTVTVLLDGEAFEVTTFRTDLGYSDSRHPDGVRFLDTLRGDLARRDFTVNAMAADADGLVTDCFGGMQDLKNGCIRCVGVPEERFSGAAVCRTARLCRRGRHRSGDPRAERTPDGGRAGAPAQGALRPRLRCARGRGDGAVF